MRDQTVIDRYVDAVDSYLHVDRAHRQGVLAEIEGHLHDAVDAHVTKGGELALRYSLLYTAVVGALTAATYVGIRNGDRDPAWRRAAWVFAALTGGIVAMGYAH